MESNRTQFSVIILAGFALMTTLGHIACSGIRCSPTQGELPESLSSGSESSKLPYPHESAAIRIAEFLLSIQDLNGAIPDCPGSGRVNTDSNMEYALAGIAAAYRHTKHKRFLEALEKGIRWLSDREELYDPEWRGSWAYSYSKIPPYEPIPSPVEKTDIADIRGVDATGALFAYLVYLHVLLSGSGKLATELEPHVKAALDFVHEKNKSADGFFCSSWQLSENGEWRLWRNRYSADQADMYLGFRAGWFLYRKQQYGDVAEHLLNYASKNFFRILEPPETSRFAVGMDEEGNIDMSMDDFAGIFPQGYLPWIFGSNSQTLSAFKWLPSHVDADGSMSCFPGDQHFSLAASVYILASTRLGEPFPAKSADWIIRVAFDPSDGGVRDTSDPSSPKFSNVAGFAIMALLGFPLFPEE